MLKFRWDFRRHIQMDIGEQSHSYYPTSIITPTFVPLISLFNCSIIYTLISSMPVFHLIIIMSLSRYLLNCRIFIFFDSMYVFLFQVILDKAVIVIRMNETKMLVHFHFRSVDRSKSRFCATHDWNLLLNLKFPLKWIWMPLFGHTTQWNESSNESNG